MGISVVDVIETNIGYSLSLKATGIRVIEVTATNSSINLTIKTNQHYVARSSLGPLPSC